MAVTHQKRAVLFVLSLPLAWLLYLTFTQRLGANPVEFLLHQTGLFALWTLLMSLSLTPLRSFGFKTTPFRRRVGLIVYFYMLLHLSVYLFLDRQLYIEDIVIDLTERPYIVVGFVAILFTSALAVTSTSAMQKRLKSNWKKLHRSVYAIGVLSVLHFLWAVKADTLEPLFYGGILSILLLLRLPMFKRIINQVFRR